MTPEGVKKGANRFEALVFGATWQIEDTRNQNAVVCGGPLPHHVKDGVELGRAMHIAEKCGTPEGVLKVMGGWVQK